MALQNAGHLTSRYMIISNQNSRLLQIDDLGRAGMILGWPYPKRIKLLQDLQKTQTGHTHTLRFQEKLQYFQIYSLSIDCPKYRLKNGRTAAAQVEYLATNASADRDLFTADPESERAQEVQHTLLKGMINESGLYKYFKEHVQEQPVILDQQGFIVNGNRRVCALRELLEDNPDQFGHFRNIDVVILPPADESDIDWLEGKEQIHKDITAGYSWATTAVMYRTRMNEHNQDVEYVSRLYEVERSEVIELIDMLEHAEAYLRDRNKSGQYSLVGSEYAFRQLRKFRAKLDSEGKKNVYDQISYAIIEDPEGDRAYQALADLSKFFPKVVSSIQSEFQLTRENQESSGSLLGAGPTAAVAAVVKVLKDETKRDRIREVVREVLASENEVERERKKGTLVHARLKKSSELLEEALGGLKDDTPRVGLSEILTDIENSVLRLRRWLNGKPGNQV